MEKQKLIERDYERIQVAVEKLSAAEDKARALVKQCHLLHLYLTEFIFLLGCVSLQIIFLGTNSGTRALQHCSFLRECR